MLAILITIVIAGAIFGARKLFKRSDNKALKETPEKSEYRIVKICPGRRHAWVSCKYGTIRKPIDLRGIVMSTGTA